MIRYLITFSLIFFSLSAFSQETELSESISGIAEELAADDTDPEAVSLFIERLNDLADNPVKINSSSSDEITRLFFLSDFQVKSLADYVHTSGSLLSVYEIAAIPGFDTETAMMMTPFITLDRVSGKNSDSLRIRHTLISTFSIKVGNNDTSSLGSDWKVLTKYKFAAGAFTGGFTMEKDPGEIFFTGTPPVPDFLSAYLSFSGKNYMKRIIIGDFTARFGQGTNINTGIRRGISLTTPGYLSASDDLKPYTSTEENKFFRGVATVLSLRNFELSLFISKNNIDATVTSEDSLNYCIENFYQSGVHNTPTLLQKKDAVSELAYGSALSYNLKNLKIGLVWSESRFSLPVNGAENNPEKIFDFRGSGNSLLTVYYNTIIRKILNWGEISINRGNLAVIEGIALRPADRLTINILLRDYTPGFTSFYGQGPGSGSKSTNEYGIMANFTLEAAKHFFVSGGYDIHHSPWLKYRCSAPSSGIKEEVKLRWMPTEKITLETLYDYRSAEENINRAEGIAIQAKTITKSLRSSVRYSVNEILSLGTRIDFKCASPSGSKGMSLLQDVVYTFRKIPVVLWARYCIFNTDSWDSRIYTYENDLLYSYCIPALSGPGSRSYLMIKWKIARVAELRIKYGCTSVIKEDRSVQNTSDIKMQCSIRF